jgi:hypothetical protein
VSSIIGQALISALIGAWIPALSLERPLAVPVVPLMLLVLKVLKLPH